MNSPDGKKRIFCVDLLRGLDIFYLLVLSGEILHGGFFKIWPLSSPAATCFWTHSLTAFAAGPEHVPTGFGILDFAQPLFVFVTGVSASLAMSRFVSAEGFSAAAFWKRLLKRTLMLWAIGSIIRGALSFSLFCTVAGKTSFCLYADTLHTIAVAYFAASVGLLLRSQLRRLVVALALIAGTAAVLAFCGDYTQHGNAARLLEEAVFARLGGRAKDFCYLLTTFTWAGMGILASLAGDVLRGGCRPWEKARTLAAAGAAAFLLGWALSFRIPAIRYIYTASFAFETLGLSTLLLAALYVLTDIWGWRRGTWLLILFGQCSLAAWVIEQIFGTALGAAASRLVDGIPKLVGTDTYQPIFIGLARAAILTWLLFCWRRLRDAKRGNQCREAVSRAPALLLLLLLLLPRGSAVAGEPDWTLVSTAPWQARDSQAEWAFGNRLWIGGGWFQSFQEPPRDVWSSRNGRDWERVTEKAPWTHSDLAMSAVFQDRLWIMGGWYKGRLPGHSACNQVWASEDGVNWRSVVEHAGWSPRLAAGLVAHRGRLWLLGGIEDYYFGTDASLKNDVWSSADGKEWKLETPNAGWSPRAYHQSVVLNGRIYVLGGGNYKPGYHATNDVWSSSDGVHWTCETASAPWAARLWFGAAAYRGCIWVLGGWSKEKDNHGDVWYSTDGKVWRRLETKTCWKSRHEHSTLVFDDKLWVMGGHARPLSSEVWCLWLPADWKGG